MPQPLTFLQIADGQKVLNEVLFGFVEALQSNVAVDSEGYIGQHIQETLTEYINDPGYRYRVTEVLEELQRILTAPVEAPEDSCCPPARNAEGQP